MGLQLYAGPSWFSGLDLAIDFISVIILVLIAYSAFSYYRITKKKNHMSIFMAFSFLAISFIFKILTYFTLYNTKFKLMRSISQDNIVYNFVPINTLFVATFLIYASLTLLGLYFLYSIYEQRQSRRDFLLIIYLLIITTVFSSNLYYIFHLTTLLLAVFITSIYTERCKKNHMQTTKMLAWSFAVIAISQAIFMFTHLHSLVYVTAELFQLAGYLWLLITFIMVLRNAKKKGSSSDN